MEPVAWKGNLRTSTFRREHLVEIVPQHDVQPVHGRTGITRTVSGRLDVSYYLEQPYHASFACVWYDWTDQKTSLCIRVCRTATSVSY